jgi:hypothetical protein
MHMGKALHCCSAQHSTPPAQQRQTMHHDSAWHSQPATLHYQCQNSHTQGALELPILLKGALEA